MNYKFGDIVKHSYLPEAPRMMVLSGSGDGYGVKCRYWSGARGKFEEIELLEKELESYQKQASSGFASSS